MARAISGSLSARLAEKKLLDMWLRALRSRSWSSSPAVTAAGGRPGWPRRARECDWQAFIIGADANAAKPASSMAELR